MGVVVMVNSLINHPIGAALTCLVEKPSRNTLW